MKHYLTLVLILMLSITGSAHAYNGYYAPAKQSIENPVNTIQNTLDKLQKFSANRDNTNPRLLRAFISNEIVPHFAFDQMTRWVAGPFARRMNTSNMLALEERITNTFLTSLDKHLSNYNSSKIRANIRRAQFRGRDEAIVTALFFSPNQRPDRLEFRMKLQDNLWKIVDVTANGLSASLYYRNHFISTLRQFR